MSDKQFVESVTKFRTTDEKDKRIAALEAECERLRNESGAAMFLTLTGEITKLRAELAALKAVPEEVEVVAYRRFEAQDNECAEWELYLRDVESSEPLMTVAQHNAIVASLSPENQRTVPAPPLLADRHPMEARQPVADNQQANQQAEREAFEVWWLSPSQQELRDSCAKGWAEIIWKAALAAHNAEV